jgi:predicted MFS family arabinose efflux permease
MMATDTREEQDRAVSRLMLFFAVVYVVEGVGQARFGIIYQPLTHFLKAEGWTPLQVTAYFGALNFPWVIKPLFGLISDFVPLFGYRRTSYLLLASGLAVVGYAGVAVLEQPSDFALFLLFTSYAMATASTLCGALLAENARTFHQSSRFVGQQWLWFYVAIMASALIGGVLVEHLPAPVALKTAAAIAAIVPLASIVATLVLLREPRSTVNRESFRDTWHGIMAAVTSRQFWLVAALLFVIGLAAGLNTPLYYHMADQLGFSQAYIGVVGSVTSAGWIAGALLHRWALRGLGDRTLLYFSIVLGTVAAAAFLLLTGGLATAVTAAIVNFAYGLASMIATIATVSIAAQRCPDRAEGFAFAGLMSVSNLADICAINAGAFLYEQAFDHRLGPLALASAATMASAALLVPLLGLEREEAGQRS